MTWTLDSFNPGLNSTLAQQWFPTRTAGTPTAANTERENTLINPALVPGRGPDRPGEPEDNSLAWKGIAIVLVVLFLVWLIKG
jgi:hypothetical protein